MIRVLLRELAHVIVLRLAADEIPGNQSRVVQSEQETRSQLVTVEFPDDQGLVVRGRQEHVEHTTRKCRLNINPSWVQQEQPVSSAIPAVAASSPSPSRYVAAVLARTSPKQGCAWRPRSPLAWEASRPRFH